MAPGFYSESGKDKVIQIGYALHKTLLPGYVETLLILTGDVAFINKQVALNS